MFDLRGFLIGWGIVALILTGYYAVEEWPRIEEKLAMYGVRGCIKEERGLLCVRPYVQKLLATRSGAQVMTLFDRELPPMTCHYFGHTVGQETYLQHKDVEAAISSCNRACDSACVHGVVGGAFAEALGVDGFAEIKLDLEHLGPDQLREIGERLCTTAGTCHGVGHSLFQIYQEFEAAFALCRDVANRTTVNMCYNGVTMEFADALSARSMGSLPGVEFPALERLDTFCDYPTISESRACFRYYPRIVITTLAREGVSEMDALERVKRVCEAYDSVNRRMACYGGLGSFGSYLILRSIPEAVNTCESLGSKQAAASCIIGRIGVATEDRGENLAAYCAASGSEYRDICYHGLFYSLNRVGIPQEEQEKLCAIDDAPCLAGLGKNTLDPLEEVRAYPR